MNLLYMLLSLVFIVIAALAYQKLVIIREGFIAVAETQSIACPQDLTVERINGITYCNDKEKKHVCTLGGNGTPDYPTCADAIDKPFNKKALEFCPPSMKNYFEDPTNNTSGCTSGTLNQTRTAPKETSAIQCAIYDSDLDTTTMTSCFNQNQLETTQLFGENATKNLMPVAITKPAAYVTVMQYKRPGTSMPNGCVPDEHAMHIIDYMRKHIDKTLPADQQEKEMGTLAMGEQFIKSGNFLGSCEAQKKVYVDHTLQESDLVPHMGLT